MKNTFPQLYNATVGGVGKIKTMGGAGGLWVKKHFTDFKKYVAKILPWSNGTEGPDLGNSSVPPETREQWNQFNGQDGMISELNPNFDKSISTDSSMTANNDSSLLYWEVGLAVVISSVVAVLLTWMLLTWRRRSCHNSACHELSSSPSDFKQRPSTAPRLQLTPDVIPQQNTQSDICIGPTSSSQPECIELKSYLLPYLSARKESTPGETHGNCSRGRTQGSVSENRNECGAVDESSNHREQQNCIQLRPPAPTPQPECLTDSTVSAFRENSFYANIPNENNIYAIPRTQTPSEVLSSSNREFVHVYELPPDFVNSELDPVPSTRCLFWNSP